MPGGAVGGLLAFVLFAAAAGFVAVFVWKGKTTRDAFFIGLAFPYALTGFLADAQHIARIRQAHGQYSGAVGGFGTTPRSGTAPQGPLAVLQLAVAGADGRRVEKFNTGVLASDRELAIATKNPGEILLPPGTYRVVVSAAGYKSAAVNVTIEGPEPRQLSITLSNSTFAYDVWNGFRAIILPNRDW